MDFGNPYELAPSSAVTEQRDSSQQSAITNFNVTDTKCSGHVGIQQACYEGCTNTPWSLMLGAMAIAQTTATPRIKAYSKLSEEVPRKLRKALLNLGEPAGSAAVASLPEANRILIRHWDRRKNTPRYDASTGDYAEMTDFTMSDAVAELECGSEEVDDDLQASWKRIRSDPMLHMSLGQAETQGTGYRQAQHTGQTLEARLPNFEPCALHSPAWSYCLGQDICNPAPLQSVLSAYRWTAGGARETLDWQHIVAELQESSDRSSGRNAGRLSLSIAQEAAREEHYRLTAELGARLYPLADSVAREILRQQGAGPPGSRVPIDVTALMDIFELSDVSHPDDRVQNWQAIKASNAEYATSFNERVAAITGQMTDFSSVPSLSSTVLDPSGHDLPMDTEWYA